MKLITYFILAMFSVSSGLTAAAQKSKKITKDTVVSGQVFIVTKGSENIRLALVVVSAIPYIDMQAHLKLKKQFAIEQQNILKPKYDIAKVEYDIAKTQSKEEKAKVAEERAGEAYRSDDSFKSERWEDRAPLKFTNPQKKIEYMQAMEEAQRIRAQPDNLDYSLKLRNYEDLKRQYNFYNMDNFASLLPLPLGIAQSKTDADGKFSLNIPVGKYMFVANARRDVSGTTEQYQWLVLVDASLHTQPLLLSNDNLMQTD